MENKKIKKRIYSSILTQQIKKTDFFLIESKLEKKIKKTRKEISLEIQVSKAISKYNARFASLRDNNLNSATTVINFYTKQALIGYINTRKGNQEFVSLIKLKNFYLKLPEDNFKKYLLTEKMVNMKLVSLYFYCLKTFILINNKEKIKLISK